MSHSERIPEWAKEAAKEIEKQNEDAADAMAALDMDTSMYHLGKDAVAAIISKHIPEQNEILITALNRMIGRCSPSPSGRFRRLDQKLFSELYDIYTQAMHPAEWAKANALATPSEPLGVMKHLGVEPVPTISKEE